MKNWSALKFWTPRLSWLRASCRNSRWKTSRSWRRESEMGGESNRAGFLLAPADSFRHAGGTAGQKPRRNMSPDMAIQEIREVRHQMTAEYATANLSIAIV